RPAPFSLHDALPIWWCLRREHLFLTPGDSPLGYRLPLDALPWEVPEERERVPDVDPFALRGPLPSQAELMQRQVRRPEPHAAPRSEEHTSELQSLAY